MYYNNHCEKVGDDMELIKRGLIENINLENLRLLSEQGSEFIVYNGDNKVYKIFRPNYNLEHKSIEKLTYLSSIKTFKNINA